MDDHDQAMNVTEELAIQVQKGSAPPKTLSNIWKQAGLRPAILRCEASQQKVVPHVAPIR
jgi:hypothetical protein